MHKAIGLSAAVEKIPDGASVMIGGFLGVGSPHRELVRQGRKSLTVFANDTARPGVGIGLLIAAKAVRKVVVSHIGTNPETQRQIIASELEAELCPQGTLAERIRAAGFGLGGVLTPTGVGTTVAEGKRTVEVDGHDFLLEPPLKAEFALIAAKRCDYRGNLDYALTARNFNPIMATAATTVIVEPAGIVASGFIPPDYVRSRMCSSTHNRNGSRSWMTRSSSQGVWRWNCVPALSLIWGSACLKASVICRRASKSFR